MMSNEELELFISKTTLDKDWIRETNAKPSAFCFFLLAHHKRWIATEWTNDKGEKVWDDENALVMPSTVIVQIK